MEALLTYLWQSALVLTVLFVPFQLLLRKERFFALNRAILLSILVLSLILPLSLHSMPSFFERWRYQVMNDVGLLNINLESAIVGEDKSAADYDVVSTTPSWWEQKWMILLLMIWLFGAIVYIVLQTKGIKKLCRILNDRSNIRESLSDGSILLLTQASLPSFSWMHSIVMSVDDYAENGAIILAHERAHIAHRHSHDRLLLLTVQCLQWWNPFVWLLDDSLSQIHEYQADMAVVGHGINATQYQLLLISKAVGPAGLAMVNGFKRNKLKYRIIMMNETNNQCGARCRYLILLPMMLIALACTSNIEPINDEPTEEQNAVSVEEHKVSVTEASMTNSADVQILVNSLGKILLSVADQEPVVVSIDEFPEYLGSLDAANTVVTIKVASDTPMPLVKDIKNALRKLWLTKLTYKQYQQ